VREVFNQAYQPAMPILGDNHILLMHQQFGVAEEQVDYIILVVVYRV
jgi:hypothetical protein